MNYSFLEYYAPEYLIPNILDNVFMKASERMDLSLEKDIFVFAIDDKKYLCRVKKEKIREYDDIILEHIMIDLPNNMFVCPTNYKSHEDISFFKNTVGYIKNWLKVTELKAELIYNQSRNSTQLTFVNETTTIIITFLDQPPGVDIKDITSV